VVIVRSASVFLPETSSVQACWAQAAGAAAVTLMAVVPTAEECVEAANARSAEGFAGAAHSGWVLADCSAVLPAHDSARAVELAGPWADDSVPACLVPAGSVVLTAHGSTPADSSAQADRCGLRCSLDAPPAHLPVAELPHDSPERYKASPLVSREPRRCL
jgi:hypothetical protein